MLQASLRELVEAGRLGTLTLRSTRATVRTALGDPEQSSTITNKDSQPSIWKYGDLEFHFSEGDTLWLIHTDTFVSFPRGGRKLRLDPWIFRRSLTAEAMIVLCEQLQLPCEAVVRPWFDPEERRFLLGIGVEVTFATSAGKNGERLEALSYAWKP
jgi:hypothetical protein